MAKVYITEYARLGRDAAGYLTPFPDEPALATQVLDIADASAQSAAVNASTTFVRVHNELAVAAEIGTDPTTSTSTRRLPPNSVEYFSVPKGRGYKVAVASSPDPSSRVLFLQGSTKVIANTGVETTQFASTIGSLVVPAFTLKVGSVVRLRLDGHISTGPSAGDATIRIKFGGQTLVTSTGTLANNLSRDTVLLEFPFACQAEGVNGSVMGSGYTLVHGGPGVAAVSGRDLVMAAPVTINTQIDNTIDVTYQWASPSVANSLEMTNAEVILRYIG